MPNSDDPDVKLYQFSAWYIVLRLCLQARMKNRKGEGLFPICHQPFSLPKTKLQSSCFFLLFFSLVTDQLIQISDHHFVLVLSICPLYAISKVKTMNFKFYGCWIHMFQDSMHFLGLLFLLEE